MSGQSSLHQKNQGLESMVVLKILFTDSIEMERNCGGYTPVKRRMQGKPVKQQAHMPAIIPLSSAMMIITVYPLKEDQGLQKAVWAVNSS